MLYEVDGPWSRAELLVAKRRAKCELWAWTRIVLGSSAHAELSLSAVAEVPSTREHERDGYVERVIRTTKLKSISMLNHASLIPIFPPFSFSFAA